MFDTPEIIKVLRESGASEEVVERVKAHFTTRMGRILDEMAAYFENENEILIENKHKQFELEQINGNKENGRREEHR
jgi:hypothetical protein